MIPLKIITTTAQFNQRILHVEIVLMNLFGDLHAIKMSTILIIRNHSKSTKRTLKKNQGVFSARICDRRCSE